MAEDSGNGWKVDARLAELENGWAILTISLPNDAPPDMHRWFVIQELKNQAVGADREAFELFPAASRAVTDGPERHLYVLPKGIQLPIGMTAEGISAWAAKATPPRDVIKAGIDQPQITQESMERLEQLITDHDDALAALNAATSAYAEEEQKAQPDQARLDQLFRRTASLQSQVGEIENDPLFEEGPGSAEAADT